jgi:tRNA(Ile)-lysidine synthase
VTDANRFLSDLVRALGGAAPERVGLAVSGGPDSMAMLALAADALPGGVEAATVNHGLRAEAAAEAALVAGACAAMDVPHATLRPGAPVAGGAGVQARARDARYRLLGEWAAARGLGCVLTAHHADDQAETFLMRAGRAAGLAGLAGARPRAVIAGLAVVRPLLDWRRAELRAVVRRRELPFADDPSNRDDRFERTRVRHLLDANEWLAPAGIARAAGYLAEADADLGAAVAWLWEARAVQEGVEVRVNALDLPRELRRRLARRAVAAVRDAAGIAEPAFGEASNVEALLDGLEAGRRVTQGGVAASVRAGRWRLRPQPARTPLRRGG